MALKMIANRTLNIPLHDFFMAVPPNVIYSFFNKKSSFLMLAEN